VNNFWKLVDNQQSYRREFGVFLFTSKSIKCRQLYNGPLIGSRVWFDAIASDLAIVSRSLQQFDIGLSQTVQENIACIDLDASAGQYEMLYVGYYSGT